MDTGGLQQLFSASIKQRGGFPVMFGFLLNALISAEIGQGSP
jgi:hypothetical protein